MKKRYKTLIALGTLITVPAIINHYIFKYFSGPYRTEFEQLTYHWRYGNIRYTRSGSGKPLLLIHGIGPGNSSYEWNNCVLPLSKYYTVYTIDLIGFGNSAKPAVSTSSYMYTAFINDFIENVIGQPVLLAANGNSADFAVLAHSFKPENFKKMLLIAPTGIGDAKTGCQLSKLTQILFDMPVLGTSFYNIITSKFYTGWFLKKYCYYNDAQVNMKMINRYHKAAHSGGVGAKYPIGAFLSGYLSTNVEDKLQNMDIPVHILWGGGNLLNPVNNLYNLRKEGSNIHFSIIENARLLPHAEHPKTFIKLCKEFFG